MKNLKIRQEDKMKLWKVKVNNWGWPNPRTYFFRSKDEAWKFSNKYSASDGFEYAGNYTDKNARKLLCEDSDDDL